MEKKGRARLSLATYFSDASPFYEDFQKLPVDGLVLDCIYGKNLLAQLNRSGSQKVLFLGVVDGRSSHLESPEEVLRILEPALSSFSGQEVYLTSSCGLEYLPHKKAFEKLQLLASLKESLYGTSKTKKNGHRSAAVSNDSRR